MQLSRTKVLLVAGALVLVGTSYFLLRPRQKPGNEGVAALQEDFRLRKAAPVDVAADAIVGQRDQIADRARAKLVEARLAPGHEAEIAGAFADLITAYRSPTAEKFIEFNESRGVPSDPERLERRRQGWSRANLMAAGRRTDPDSITASTIFKASETSVSDTGASKFYSWIKPDHAVERGLSVNSSVRVVCLTIRMLEQEQGPGSPYNLMIDFARAKSGKWLPVINLMEGATERPVYQLPL